MDFSHFLAIAVLAVSSISFFKFLRAVFHVVSNPNRYSYRYSYSRKNLFWTVK